ncbi:MAG: 3-phosphoshikimate 1-carboxyvinyltransferase [Thermaerobacter sp.]|nr:3-phosphoshikimate 1-carboxyvinyltransferase [Thermaerobacter sp.]
MKLEPWAAPLQRTMQLPGDKSITHRAMLFSVLAQGPMVVRGWLDAQDTRSSLNVARALGVSVTQTANGDLVLHGPGAAAMREPDEVLDCGNSGTTMRLTAGLLSGLHGIAVLSGDSSLRRRPMARVAEPLRAIGVTVLTRRDGQAPLIVQGGPHSGGAVRLPIASAQVKSALLLAGLSADRPVQVAEPVRTRDHTERMLRAMGADLTVEGTTVTIHPGSVRGMEVQVPGDPSSAAFWAAAAALMPGSRLHLAGVLLNPSRIGFYRVLERMGVQITMRIARQEPEPVGDLIIEGGALRGVRVAGAEVPDLVDEIPLVALLAARAEGESLITGAGELRVKESDRIHATVDGLSRMGARIAELPDGFQIEGVPSLSGAEVDAYDDHRIAMMLTVASAIATGPTWLHGSESVAISYPEFFQQMHSAQRGAG